MFWSHKPVAPWQSKTWLAQMREQHRANAYLRQIENRWVSTESTFVDIAWWDACVDVALRPVLSDHTLPVWVGVDASVKRDSTAVVACTWEAGYKRVQIVRHRIFEPTVSQPLDFEATVEATLVELNRTFDVREIRYDPFQLIAVAQRLERAGLRMVEFEQTVSNLTEASSNLYELIQQRNLRSYQDDHLRLAVNRSIALETPRGRRIAKEKASDKIDVVVALAMASLAALRGGGRDYEGLLSIYRRENEQNRALEMIVGAGAPGWMRGVMSAKCAKCQKPLPPNSVIVQTRGEKFCSQACAW